MFATIFVCMEGGGAEGEGEGEEGEGEEGEGEEGEGEEGEGEEDGDEMAGIFNCFEDDVITEIVACIDAFECEDLPEGEDPGDVLVESCFPDFGD